MNTIAEYQIMLACVATAFLVAVGIVAILSTSRMAAAKSSAIFALILATVLFGHYPTQGEKGAGEKGVRFYRTDPEFEWLKDMGSRVHSNDVYIAFMPHARLPDSAIVQLWRHNPYTMPTNSWLMFDSRAVDGYTLAGDGSRARSMVFPYTDGGGMNALSNDWAIITTYVKPSEVVTNGVLHADWLLVKPTTSEAVSGVPTHTRVTLDGEDVIAPPKPTNGLTENAEHTNEEAED